MAASVSGASVNMSGHLQNQLTRSLERILEDAFLSGELRLSGRKLKDFPKTGKYDLTDTVIADLSKNRLGDLPDELTSYLYLERLLLGHNAIRQVPDTVGSLQSLTYLDVSFNHLSEIPRELCLLPLEVLVVANNLLTSLPKEVGKMSTLAELDAGCNRITQLPIAIGDLSNLRSLNLRNNQLALLPLQITYLRLEMLDVSCNCISSLPLELRMMSSLVILKLDHNPLVSPPTIVCMRGRVHIFRYLENMANRESVTHRRHDDIRRSGKHSSPYGGYVTPPGSGVPDLLRARTRHTVDSGYNTCDGEKRWSNDGVPDDSCLMYPGTVLPSALVTIPSFSGNGIVGGSGRSTPSTPSTLSPGSANLSRTQSLTSDGRVTPQNSGIRVSPDGNLTNGEDKAKSLNHQQTYRQYKEALRQQRQQDIYRPREQASPVDTELMSHAHHSPVHLPKHSQSTPHSPIANGHYVSSLPSSTYSRNVSSNPSLSTATGTLSNSLNGSLPIHSTPLRSQSPSISCNNFNGCQSPNNFEGTVTKHFVQNEEIQIRRPVQKVVPSRNVSTCNKSYTSPASLNQSSNGSILNGNPRLSGSPIEHQKMSQNQQDGGYIKPSSPTKSPLSILQSNIPPNNAHYIRRESPNATVNGSEQIPKLLTTTVGYLKGTNPKPPGGSGRLTWNKDVPPDKLSFTMKREFDKAKEESDLICQLRNIIETRLKMTLPEDIAPVLADGVVLCHLANHVRPRAVGSVHVPSPAQPKLTMARCRRNVDNFLEACRRIGVEEGAICRPDDVLQCEDCSERERRHRLISIARTVSSLTDIERNAATTHAADRLSDDDDGYNDRSFTEYEHANAFYSDDYSSIETIRMADSNGKYINDQFLSDEVDNVYNSSDSFQDMTQLQLKHIGRNHFNDDRLVSNFNSFTTETTLINPDFENSNAKADDSGNQNKNRESSVLRDFIEVSRQKRLNNCSLSLFDNVDQNKINKVIPIIQSQYFEKAHKNKEPSNVSRRINHFNNYNRANMNLYLTNNLNEAENEETNSANIENNKLITILCLGTFFLSVILLYIFPLP